MKYLTAHFTIKGKDKVSKEHLSKEEIQTACDLLSDLLCEAGFESFEYEDEGMAAYVQESVFDEHVVRQLLADEWTLEKWQIDYNIVPAEDKNWNVAWEEEGFDPIIINDRCAIYDAKHPERVSLDILNMPLSVGIEAQMAFGTGTHETTRMIVQLLTELEVRDKKVLDCGCGTGILSIVASKLGAQKVVGYDIDEWSVRNTIHNAQLNDVKIEALCGNSAVLQGITAYFDIIVANINRNILLEDMPRMVSALTKGGTLILSGFYEDDAALLTDKAQTLGLTPTAMRSDNKWTCLAFE